MTKPSYLSCAAIALASLLTLTGRAAAAPQSISFTGNLSDEAGPVATAVNITARVFDATGQKLWEERHNNVQPERGLVFLELGGVDRQNNPLDSSVFDGSPRYLELEVDGDVLSPRIALLAVPYASHAERAENADRADLAGEAEFAQSAGSAASCEKLGSFGPDDFAQRTHNHDADYLKKGASLACGPTQKVIGLNGTTGSVVCAEDLNSSASYTAGTGLQLSAGQFSLAASGVTSAHIANGAVTASDLASNSVTSSHITNGTITSSDIGTGQVTGTNIANGTITSSDIASATITGSNIANATISGSKLANSTVTNTQLADGAVSEAKLANGAVSAAKIASDTITRAQVSGEKAVYQMVTGCGSGLTMSSSCKTRLGLNLAGAPTFLACNGTAPAVPNLTAVTCNLSTVGYLLAP